MATPDLTRNVAHWRDRLDHIDAMLTEIPEQHITIASQRFDLAGPQHAATPPLPGGERLAITGPWAADATYGDDTPHPRQVIIEWHSTLVEHRTGTTPARATYAAARRWLRDETPWILECPYAAAWRADIDQAHGLLQSLCPPLVGAEHDSTPPPSIITEDQLWDALSLHPEHHLSRRDLQHLGIPTSTITTWRSRGKLTETEPGKYRAGDVVALRASG